MSQAHKHIPYKYMVQIAIDVYIPAKFTNIRKIQIIIMSCSPIRKIPRSVESSISVSRDFWKATVIAVLSSEAILSANKWVMLPKLCV